jgi:hypothetical protein
MMQHVMHSEFIIKVSLVYLVWCLQLRSARTSRLTLSTCNFARLYRTRHLPVAANNNAQQQSANRGWALTLLPLHPVAALGETLCLQRRPARTSGGRTLSNIRPHIKRHLSSTLRLQPWLLPQAGPRTYLSFVTWSVPCLSQQNVKGAPA